MSWTAALIITAICLTVAVIALISHRRMMRKPAIKMPTRSGAPTPSFAPTQRKERKRAWKHGRSKKLSERRIEVARARQGLK